MITRHRLLVSSLLSACFAASWPRTLVAAAKIQVMLYKTPGQTLT
jgi:hypothetical protein